MAAAVNDICPQYEVRGERLEAYCLLFPGRNLHLTIMLQLKIFGTEVTKLEPLLL